MYRFIRDLTAPTVGAIILLGAPTSSQAQSPTPRLESATAALLDALARERAARWSSSAPAIQCAPAPLTEQPGIVAERSRPAVLPLETAFLDAARVKRMLVARIAGSAAHQ
jgi:hypothetical protein